VSDLKLLHTANFGFEIDLQWQKMPEKHALELKLLDFLLLK